MLPHYLVAPAAHRTADGEGEYETDCEEVVRRSDRS
jgi:hypothetical protein